MTRPSLTEQLIYGGPHPRIGFVNLGCPKALVDSECILAQLRTEGYEVAPSYENAGLVVVNTCGFIEAAIGESLCAIDEAPAENGRVIVTGCLGARAAHIRDRFPEVPGDHGPTAEDTLRRIEAWRAVSPEIALRSTFIVGFAERPRPISSSSLFPVGRATRLRGLSVLPVDGAKANDLPDPVPQDVKRVTTASCRPNFGSAASASAPGSGNAWRYWRTRWQTVRQRPAVSPTPPRSTVRLPPLCGRPACGRPLPGAGRKGRGL